MEFSLSSPKSDRQDGTISNSPVIDGDNRDEGKDYLDHYHDLPGTTSGHQPVASRPRSSAEASSRRRASVAVVGALLLALLGGIGGYILGAGSHAAALPTAARPSLTPTPGIRHYVNRGYGFGFSYWPDQQVYSIGDDYVVLVNTHATVYGIELIVAVDQFRGDFAALYAAANGTIAPGARQGHRPKLRKLRNRVIDGYRAVDYLVEAPGFFRDPGGSFPAGTLVDRDGVLIDIVADGRTQGPRYDYFLSTFRLKGYDDRPVRPSPATD